MNWKRDVISKNGIHSLMLLIIYIVVLYYLIDYVIENTDMMARLISVPKSLLVFGIIITFVAMMLNVPLDIVCARVYGFHLEVKEATVFGFIASAINLVFPLQIGSALKAIYYKRRMGLSYSKYLSIMSGTIVIQFIITFFVLILSLLFMLLEWNIEIKYVIFASMAFFTGVFLTSVTIHFQDKILDILPLKTYTYPIMSGFFELFSNKKAMLSCCLIFIIKNILGGIRCSIIFICLGLATGFVNGMLYYGLYCASSMVAIFPGNVGISEILVGGMNILLGEDFNMGVIVVFANRVYYCIVAFAGALIAAIPAWIMFGKEKYNSDGV